MAVSKLCCTSSCFGHRHLCCDDEWLQILSVLAVCKVGFSVMVCLRFSWQHCISASCCFNISYFIIIYFCHSATQDCYSHFNLYALHVSVVYDHHQVSLLFWTVHCTACLNFTIKIKIGHHIKFSKNGFDLLVGSISVIFGGVGVFHVDCWCWCVCWFLIYMSLVVGPLPHLCSTLLLQHAHNRKRQYTV